MTDWKEDPKEKRPINDGPTGRCDWIPVEGGVNTLYDCGCVIEQRENGMVRKRCAKHARRRPAAEPSPATP